MELTYNGTTLKPEDGIAPEVSFSNTLSKTEGGALLGGETIITLKGQLIRGYTYARDPTGPFEIGTISDLVFKCGSSSVDAPWAAVRNSIDVPWSDEDVSISDINGKEFWHIKDVETIGYNSVDSESNMSYTEYTITLRTYSLMAGFNQFLNNNAYTNYNIESVNVTRTISSKPDKKPHGGGVALDFPITNTSFPIHKVTNNINVKAKRSAGLSAIQVARNFATAINDNDDFLKLRRGGAINNQFSNTTTNYSKTIDEDVIAGSYALTEEYDIYENQIQYIDEYNVNLTNNLDNYTATVNGSLTATSLSAWTDTCLAASGLMNGNSLYSRIGGSILSRSIPNLPGTTISTFLPGKVNPVPTESSLTFNKEKLIIEYSSSYDSRPLSLVSGALTEDIQINDNFSTRTKKYATRLIHPPVLQDYGTYTIPQRTVTYTATFPYNLGYIPATTETYIDNVLDAFNPSKSVKIQETTTAWHDSWITSASSSFDTSNGSYNRSITWEYQRY